MTFSQGVAKNDSVLTLQTNLGEFERTHYWHFMAGFFLPFVSTHDLTKKFRLPNFGAMNKFFVELGVDFEIYNDKQTKGKLVERLDNPWEDYCPTYVHNFREKLFEQLKPEPIKRLDVLIIQRSTMNGYEGQPDKYEKHGSQRRWVSNIREVFEIAENYGVTRIEYLENKTLKEQIELFSSAGCVILQHGASFFNTIFCKPNTPVVEITHNKFFEKPAKWFGVDRLACQYGNRPNSAVVNLLLLETHLSQKLS